MDVDEHFKLQIEERKVTCRYAALVKESSYGTHQS